MERQDKEETLLNWLIGAYGMEKALVSVLAKQAEHAQEDYPELHKRLLEHKNETQRHADLVKGCVERHGGKISGIKTEFTKLIGKAQNQMIGMFDEKVVKETVMSSASEELEISTYKAIITLAKSLGDKETVKVCSEILKEEEEMLKFLNGQLEKVVEFTFQESRPS